jgi:hypothetical protein
MRANPFGQRDAPSWLTEDVHQLPHLLKCLLEFAELVPKLYEILPWLKEMDVWNLIQERMARAIFPDEASSPVETTVTAFFSQVTKPVAELIENLYTSSLLRHVSTIEEIVRRMAQIAAVPPLPSNAVTGVCCSFWHRRASHLSRDRIQVQETTWRISWQESSVRVRTTQGTRKPFLLLVSDETTGKILAFGSLQDPPGEADILLVLFDALVFARQDSGHLYPPAHLCVQHPLLSELLRAGRSLDITLEEVVPQTIPFVQQWERDLAERVLDLIQYTRLFDRACERTFGYAPFLAKQQAARRVGLWMRLYDDPCWSLPSLREVLPTYPAVVGSDGTLPWRGWHYRDQETDLLRYWPGEAVTVRPSPVCEAVIWVYWGQDILCCAQAEELCHKDGSYRPYWFPYRRLGE